MIVKGIEIWGEKLSRLLSKIVRPDVLKSTPDDFDYECFNFDRYNAVLSELCYLLRESFIPENDIEEIVDRLRQVQRSLTPLRSKIFLEIQEKEEGWEYAEWIDPLSDLEITICKISPPQDIMAYVGGLYAGGIKEEKIAYIFLEGVMRGLGISPDMNLSKDPDRLMGSLGGINNVFREYPSIASKVREIIAEDVEKEKTEKIVIQNTPIASSGILSKRTILILREIIFWGGIFLGGIFFWSLPKLLAGQYSYAIGVIIPIVSLVAFMKYFWKLNKEENGDKYREAFMAFILVFLSVIVLGVMVSVKSFLGALGISLMISTIMSLDLLFLVKALREKF